jgi:hypothetical protein
LVAVVLSHSQRTAKCSAEHTNPKNESQLHKD